MKIDCPACHTAYDVSGRPAGTLVTCHCGETFGFPHPPSAPLSLQCPGCGAGADPGDSRCAYCGNPLKSVCCPNCYTLMIDGARRCGQCNTGIATPALRVHRHGGTSLPCPRCSSALTANLVDEQIFDRCDRCGGIWAHHLAIDAVLGKRRHKQSVRKWLDTLPGPADTADFRGGSPPCPDCEHPMEPHQVPGRKVVIDACDEHGIWYDYREIRALAGESPRRRQRKSRRYSRVRKKSAFAGFLDDDWWPWEALEDLFDFLEDLID